MDWWKAKLSDVRYIGDYRLHIRYAHELEADVDLGDLLDHPFYASLKDKEFFAKAKIHDEISVLVWPQDIDLAPEILYKRVIQAATHGNA